MTPVSQSDTPAGSVRATLNYLVPGVDKPVTYMYVRDDGASMRTGEYRPRAVEIYDGRGAGDRLSLDVAGLALQRHESAVRDFYDDDEVRAVYYAEMERLVKAATGAERAFMFDHTRRSVRASEHGTRGPVHIVHNDYTFTSGPQRVRDLLDPAEAEQRLRSRFAVINVWRPMVDVVHDTPLAICDARSMAPADFISTEMKYPDRSGETYSVAYNPNHRWYYFPRLRRDETLLFKCFDSVTTGGARFGAHSAFDDPTSTEAPQRESIEARLLVFF